MPDRFKNVTNRWQVAEHIYLFTWFSLSGKCTRTPYFVQECVCQHFANLVRRIILYGICKMSNIFIQHFANFILNTKDWWSILSALWNWTDILQPHHGSPWYEAIFVTLLLTHLFLQLKTTTKYSNLNYSPDEAQSMQHRQRTRATCNKSKFGKHFRPEWPNIFV